MLTWTVPRQGGLVMDRREFTKALAGAGVGLAGDGLRGAAREPGAVPTLEWYKSG
jgi:hypothetical protein